MASTIQETLLEEFRKAAVGMGSAGSAGPEAVTGRTVGANAKSSALGTVESVATAVLKSGFGLLPLAGALFGLFGGGSDEETAPALVKFAMPEAIAFQGVEAGGEVMAGDFDQMGRARTYRTGAGSQVAAGSGGAAQITVNVQAMDARSFLDRSGEIAQAVREAMLNMSSLNDVVSEL